MTTTEQSYETPPALLDKLKHHQTIAAFIGLVFLVLTIAGYWLTSPQQFLRSYLIGVFFWLGMGMGCLGLLMLHMVSGGAWGVMIRRPLEAGTRVIWVMWLALLPIILMPEKLYFWAEPANASDKIVRLKQLYLNVTFWRIRWLIFGVIWIGIAYLLNKWSKLEDETKSWKYSSAMEKLSGPGIAIYFFTMTFAGIDYLMSLDVTWASTIYGFLIVVGQCLGAMSLVVAVLILLGKFEPMDYATTPKHLHDLGKLMLALVMLWAYMSFSQYLIIYSGNLPQEVTWYVRRLNGGWEWVGTILLLFHFALPFSLLLSQQLKRNPRTIAKIAIFIIFVRVIDVFWLVEPNFTSVDHPHFTVSWLDFAAPIGFGGLWLALFFRELPRRPLLPLGYPDLQKALSHGRQH
ncbi:MAG TPA: hypothetical protein VG297_11055 [Bryobacteraceae bacterium]|nr:hypothetical protein [Bryobacteraceae bacterium]